MIKINNLKELYELHENDYNKVISICLTSINLLLIPPIIFNFINLQILYLDNNQITTIPQSIANLTNLQILHLGNNNLTILPNIIDKLINLKMLFLNKNKLKTIPSTIGNLIKLQYLSLQNNQLITLPSTISNLVNLNVLVLTYNKLKTIPPSIKNIKDSQCIDVTSYDNLDNLSYDCVFLQIYGLNRPLHNLMPLVKEIRLYNPIIKDIKIPYGCDLYINNIKN